MFARLRFIMSKHVSSFFATKWQRTGSADVNRYNTKYSNYNQSCISDALKTENWKIRLLKLEKQNLHQFFEKFSPSFAIYKFIFLDICGACLRVFSIIAFSCNIKSYYRNPNRCCCHRITNEWRIFHFRIYWLSVKLCERLITFVWSASNSTRISIALYSYKKLQYISINPISW